MDAGEGKKAKEIHPPSHYRGREGGREEKRWKERESEGPEEEEEEEGRGCNGVFVLAAVTHKD